MFIAQDSVLLNFTNSKSILNSWSSTVRWITENEINILTAIIAGIAIYLALRSVRHWGKRLKNPDGDLTSYASIVGRTIARTGHVFMILASARLVIGFADAPANIAAAVRFLFTISAVFQGAIWAREFVLGMIERRSGEHGASESLHSAMGLIRLLITFAVFAIATIVVLDNLGVDVTGLVAGLGIGGIAIGLAAQGIFSDLFAALSIIFDRPFKVGDTIFYDQTVATVEQIGLKSTRLRSITGEMIVISNANLLQKEITNYVDILRRRVSMPIGVIYQTPPELAKRVPDILREVVEGEGASFVRAGMTGFGASSLDYEFFFEVYESDIAAFAVKRHEIAVAIVDRFNAEGIEFAYPTQTTFTAAPDGRMVMPWPPVLDTDRIQVEQRAP